VGVGVTPAAWNSSARALQIAGFSCVAQQDNGSYIAGFNFYQSATGFRYLTTNPIAMYSARIDGSHAFFNAPSGTAGNAITFTQAMTLDASGNFGVGNTNPTGGLASGQPGIVVGGSATGTQVKLFTSNTGTTSSDGFLLSVDASSNSYLWNYENAALIFGTNNAERARIDSSGSLLVGKIAVENNTTGSMFVSPSTSTHYLSVVNTTTDNSAARLLYLNRQGSDGDLIQFNQANTQEGSISVSGTTVSYNGGHLSRWAQTTAPKDNTLVKGTVLSNLDEMNVYTDEEGNPVDNEQLNKVKVSDVEGDVNVAGVFVNWSHDEAHDVDEINMAMTGDMIIRIAQGITVQRGDLLMSAGNGTAKPQGDDIVRSKTVAKVTSTHVTCTYPDGSFCVPCVLMAC
jgi:hypothetical protein